MSKFMIKIFGFSVIMFLGIGNLVLANDTLAVILSNTVKVVGPTGGVQNWFFNADGTLTNLEDVNGSWEMNGDKLCTIYGEKTKQGCFVLPEGKVTGDSWDQIVGSGKTVTIMIVKGR